MSTTVQTQTPAAETSQPLARRKRKGGGRKR